MTAKTPPGSALDSLKSSRAQLGAPAGISRQLEGALEKYGTEDQPRDTECIPFCPLGSAFGTCSKEWTEAY
jgi:hypothetical protein